MSGPSEKAMGAAGRAAGEAVLKHGRDGARLRTADDAFLLSRIARASMDAAHDPPLNLAKEPERETSMAVRTFADLLKDDVTKHVLSQPAGEACAEDEVLWIVEEVFAAPAMRRALERLERADDEFDEVLDLDEPELSPNPALTAFSDAQRDERARRLKPYDDARRKAKGRGGRVFRGDDDLGEDERKEADDAR
jgi:hypothetical protein